MNIHHCPGCPRGHHAGGEARGGTRHGWDLSYSSALSDLTHHETDAGDRCVLWSLAIRHAVRTGELDVGTGLDELPAERRARWTALIDEAEREQPSSFTNNFWVVQAFQGAWSAIAQTLATGPTDGSHLVRGIEAAVRCGYDTDTVAAIAGSLLGARCSPPPGGAADRAGWPAGERMEYRGYDTSALVRHPHGPRVWLGAVGALDALPDDVDAVAALPYPSPQRFLCDAVTRLGAQRAERGRT